MGDAKTLGFGSLRTRGRRHRGRGSAERRALSAHPQHPQAMSSQQAGYAKMEDGEPYMIGQFAPHSEAPLHDNDLVVELNELEGEPAAFAHKLDVDVAPLSNRAENEGREVGGVVRRLGKDCEKPCAKRSCVHSIHTPR
jgi:hypothetical protein